MSIKQVLIERDGMSEEEAQGIIEEAKEQLQIYLSEGNLYEAEYICQEFFGLEPDYLMELL